MQEFSTPANQTSPSRYLSTWLPAVIALGAISLLIGVLYVFRAAIPASQWYSWLSAPTRTLAGPLGDWADRINIPLLSVLFFGVIGAIAPCQLTTNASALAYVSRQTDSRRAMAGSALAYLLGKILVYTLVGSAVILTGQQLASNLIPVIVIARKVLGPVMIFLGLYLLGVIPLHFSFGHSLMSQIEARAGNGSQGAFLLGIAFSFAFCPTLFLLFFGWTIPLALTSPIGIIYPALFGVGATLPLLLLTTLLIGGVARRREYVMGARHLNTWLRPAAAVVLILAGLNDTVIYWLL